ncbi:MAG: hypothetical protein PHD67_09330 [Oscillospiraceae bacterium]|nr:hypothetical protein [Oscillospiraceae bacterium]
MNCCENGCDNKKWIIIVLLVLLYLFYCNVDFCNFLTPASASSNGCGCGCNRTPYCE